MFQVKIIYLTGLDIRVTIDRINEEEIRESEAKYLARLLGGF